MKPQSSTSKTSATAVKPRRHWLRWLFIIVGLLGGLFFIVGGIIAVSTYRRLVVGLPSVAELENYQPSLVTKVFDRNGELIADFFIERRFLVPLKEIPLYLQQATIAVEDARFYSHHGIDPIGILRAMRANFRAGGVREGASTITQQVARTLFLTPERTLDRKLREVILARRIEQRFSKNQILEMYLNQIFYGHNAYGVEAAAQNYFGKSVRDLSLGEAALIAGLSSAPNRYSPLNNLELSLQRRHHVLRRMIDAGYLTPERVEEVEREPIHLNPQKQLINKAPYFVEYVRRYLEEQYGATALYRGGFNVYTTLDLRLQTAAEQAIRQGLLAIDKRHGYRGPLKRLTLTGAPLIDQQAIQAVTLAADADAAIHIGDKLDGVVLEVHENQVVVAVKSSRGILDKEGFAWVREAKLQRNFYNRRMLSAQEIFSPGDVIQVRVAHIDPRSQTPHLVLEQEPVVQGALFSMEASTGYVLAMVGGYDFTSSQFNRAMQATRQPGSAFKPIIYATAIASGMTAASIIIDAPVIKANATDQELWKPENYSQKFYGPTTLRTAITHSRNLVTIRLLDKIGVSAVVDYAKRLGITSPLAPYLSLALGSSDVTLTELTTAYGVFANGGMYVPPIFISKITDAQGHVLEEHFPQAKRVIKPEVAYIMTNLLENVVKRGTGRRVRALGRPAAGKTGTTNDFRDAWFMGFTPEIVTGVWTGIDDRTTLGYRETGGRVASPIWLNFMREAMRGRPITDFIIPSGVRFVRVNAKDGVPAIGATEAETIFEVFIEGTEPSLNPSRPNDLRRDIRRLDRRRLSRVSPDSEQPPSPAN
jgi:penicillin-binding protein 1A